jgi:hypothetical protein
LFPARHSAFHRFIGLLWVVAACGCGQTTNNGSNDKSAGNERISPEYDQAGRLTKLNFDRNGNGKPDTWGYMDGSRVIRVEMDEDEDGQIDRWEHHKAPAQSSSGVPGPADLPVPASDGSLAVTVERVERATRRDGRINRTEFFDNGQLLKVEEDTDGNGAIDKWETYEKGALVLMAIDTRKAGKPDRRIRYKPDGSVEVEADETGSGVFKPLAQ